MISAILPAQHAAVSWWHEATGVPVYSCMYFKGVPSWFTKILYLESLHGSPTLHVPSQDDM